MGKHHTEKIDNNYAKDTGGYFTFIYGSCAHYNLLLTTVKRLKWLLPLNFGSTAVHLHTHAKKLRLRVGSGCGEDVTINSNESCDGEKVANHVLGQVLWLAAQGHIEF